MYIRKYIPNYLCYNIYIHTIIYTYIQLYNILTLYNIIYNYMHINSRGAVTGFLARKAAIHSELGLSWTYQVSYSFFALQRL